MGNRESSGVETHLSFAVLIVLDVCPDAFYTNFRAVKGSYVHISGSSRAEWHRIGFHKLRRKSIGCREHCLGSAYSSEFTQAFPRSWIGRVEIFESLRRFEQRMRKGGTDNVPCPDSR